MEVPVVAHHHPVVATAPVLSAQVKKSRFSNVGPPQVQKPTESTTLGKRDREEEDDLSASKKRQNTGPVVQ